jgi:hypothetical protein
MRVTLRQRRRQKLHTDASKARESFFQEQLEGEEALSWPTAEKLYAEAATFMLERPWEYLADTELILVDDPESGARCYCSIMGAEGAWCGMYVYQGDEGYRMLRMVAGGGQPDPFAFYEKQKGVSLEIVRQGDLEAADRALLKALALPLQRGILAPQFRAVRPGYLPWYVTEREGRLLGHCLGAVNALCTQTSDEDLDKFWLAEDVYPLISPGKKENQYTLRLVDSPAPGLGPIEIAELDENRVRRVAIECKKSEVILEAEHFFAPGTIGRTNERKACMQLSIVADANTGFLYHSELGLPGESHALVISRALLASMESSCIVPAEVLVKQTRLATSLAGLGVALGFEVRAVKNLPVTQEAKKSLFEMIKKRG